MHTKTKTTQTPHKQWELHTTINHQQQNHGLRTDSSLSVCVYVGGLKCIYWYQIFALYIVAYHAISSLLFAH